MRDAVPPPLRPGEVVSDDPLLARADARLVFIGRIRTPWTARGQCPKNVRERPEASCRIEVATVLAPALRGLEGTSHLIVLYWLDQARRDALVQAPAHAPQPLGTFALRSPNRPNPIGLGVVPLLRIEGATLHVLGLDCLDGTPLLDLKPYFATTDAAPDATVGWRRSE